MAEQKRMLSRTRVNAEKTRADIDRMLMDAGADELAVGVAQNQARVMFRLHGRQIALSWPLPMQPTDPRPKKTYPPDYQGSEPWGVYEQEVRRDWRVLHRIIQLQLELIAEEGLDVDDAFMPYLVLPDRSTVRDHVRPTVAEAYRTGVMPESILPSARVLALGKGT